MKYLYVYRIGIIVLYVINRIRYAYLSSAPVQIQFYLTLEFSHIKNRKRIFNLYVIIDIIIYKIKDQLYFKISNVKRDIDTMNES